MTPEEYWGREVNQNNNTDPIKIMQDFAKIKITGKKIIAYRMVFEKNRKHWQTADYTDLSILQELKVVAERYGYKYIKTITI